MIRIEDYRVRRKLWNFDEKQCEGYNALNQSLPVEIRFKAFLHEIQGDPL